MNFKSCRWGIGGIREIVNECVNLNDIVCGFRVFYSNRWLKF